MSQKKMYYYISEKINGEYDVSAYTDKFMLDVFKKSDEERNEKVIYEGELGPGTTLGKMILITNFLDSLNKKKEEFNGAELEKILTKENKNGFR